MRLGLFMGGFTAVYGGTKDCLQRWRPSAGDQANSLAAGSVAGQSALLTGRGSSPLTGRWSALLTGRGSALLIGRWFALLTGRWSAVLTGRGSALLTVSWVFLTDAGANEHLGQANSLRQTGSVFRSLSWLPSYRYLNSLTMASTILFKNHSHAARNGCRAGAARPKPTAISLQMWGGHFRTRTGGALVFLLAFT